MNKILYIEGESNTQTHNLSYDHTKKQKPKKNKTEKNNYSNQRKIFLFNLSFIFSSFTLLNSNKK
jgi:hypothetical protein